MRAILLGLPLALFAVSPESAQAQLVACTGLDCGTCEFVETAQRSFSFLISIISIIATIVLVYAGLRLVTSGGDTAAREFSKTVITNIVIGFFLVISSVVIINVIINALVTDTRVLNWQQVQCIRAIIPTAAGVGGDRAEQYGFAELPEVEGRALCNEEYLGRYFPGEERVAQCVMQGESACGAYHYSTTDFIVQDGRKVPFSYSPWQINLTVWDIEASDNCSAGPLKCTNAWTGTDWDARVTDMDLLTRCSEALREPDCSGSVAKRIRDTPRGWKHWSAYTRGNCGR